jgi:hypothetical protein
MVNRCANMWVYPSFKSAKGAARTSRGIRNCFAPHSVLREFLGSRAGPATVRRKWLEDEAGLEDEATLEDEAAGRAYSSEESGTETQAARRP